MNREIKFRVWFNEPGVPPQMIYTHLDDFIRNENGYVLGKLVLDIQFKTGIEICYDAVNGKENWLKDSLGALSDTRYNADNSNLMQYTGLNDKNGKEIYEGDIIDCVYGNGKFIVRWLHTGFVACKLKACKLKGFVGTPGSLYYQYMASIENITDKNEIRTIETRNHNLVIGNIFENPELLKNE